MNLEPSFNIDNYEDPDDFFAAFGKFERKSHPLGFMTMPSFLDYITLFFS